MTPEQFDLLHSLLDQFWQSAKAVERLDWDNLGKMRQAILSVQGYIKLESEYREFQELREKLLHFPEEQMEITDEEFLIILNSLKENIHLPYLKDAISDFKAGRSFRWMGKEIKRQEQTAS